MENPLNNGLLFLVETVFNLYIVIVMLRMLLQLRRAAYLNPVIQFLVKVTNPVLKPLQKILPGFRGLDLAAVALLLILEMVKLSIVAWIRIAEIPHIGGLALWAVGGLLSLLVNVYFYAILIQVILSWVAPSTQHPATELLYSLTEPLLGRARRIIPPLGGIDISPIPVMIVLQLFVIVLIQPMTNIGISIALGA